MSADYHRTPRPPRRDTTAIWLWHTGLALALVAAFTLLPVEAAFGVLAAIAFGWFAGSSLVPEDPHHGG